MRMRRRKMREKIRRLFLIQGEVCPLYVRSSSERVITTTKEDVGRFSSSARPPQSITRNFMMGTKIHFSSIFMSPRNSVITRTPLWICRYSKYQTSSWPKNSRAGRIPRNTWVQGINGRDELTSDGRWGFAVWFLETFFYFRYPINRCIESVAKLTANLFGAGSPVLLRSPWIFISIYFIHVGTYIENFFLSLSRELKPRA